METEDRPVGPGSGDRPDASQREGPGERFPQARHIVLVAAVFLGVSYLAILLVDILGVSGLRAWLASSELGQPMLWFYIFTEKAPAELLQWTFLAATGVTAGVLSGRLSAIGARDASRFWLLIAVTGVVLALEDAATVRHILSGFTMAVAGVEGRHLVRTLTEMAFYGAIAAIPLFALYRYWRVPYDSPSRWYLLTGFGAYAVASFTSATRDVGNWYVRVGTWVDERTGGRLGAGFVQTIEDRPVGFWIMDYIFEESMELIGAACFLAATVAYHRYAQQKGDVSGERPTRVAAAT